MRIVVGIGLQLFNDSFNLFDHCRGLTKISKNLFLMAGGHKSLRDKLHDSFQVVLHLAVIGKIDHCEKYNCITEFYFSTQITVELKKCESEKSVALQGAICHTTQFSMQHVFQPISLQKGQALFLLFSGEGKDEREVSAKRKSCTMGRAQKNNTCKQTIAS